MESEFVAALSPPGNASDLPASPAAPIEPLSVRPGSPAAVTTGSPEETRGTGPAALVDPADSPKGAPSWRTPDYVAVVGAKGGMGRLMVRLLGESGLRVLPVDLRDGEIAWEVVASCDVVILAVPLPAMTEAARSLGPYTREDGAVIDLGSLKKAPVDAMLAHCRGEVIGCHPLFGPSTLSVEGQVVFVSPGRPGGHSAWFRSFWEALGARLVDIDAERHDRLMSRVQVLRHMLLISFGLSLSRLDFEAGELAVSGPWFSHLVDLLDHQLRQAPELYADLALENPAAGQVLEEFTRAAQDVARAVADHDRDAVVGLIGQVRQYLGSFRGEDGEGRRITQADAVF